MKKPNCIVAVLLGIIFTACGGGVPSVTNVTVNISSSSPDAGLAQGYDGGMTVPPSDAGVVDIVEPEVVTFSILDGYTTSTSARFAYQVSEDGVINFRLDGPAWSRSSDFVVEAKRLYYAEFTNLQCGTLYTAVAWAKDMAGNISQQVFDTFTTKACSSISQPELEITMPTGATAMPELVEAEQNVKIGAVVVPMFAFSMTAKNEGVRVTKLKLTAKFQHQGDVKNVKLFLDGLSAPVAQVGSMTAEGQSLWSCTWTAADNLLPSFIQAGSTFVFRVRADIGSPGAAGLGDSIRFMIDPKVDVEGKGVTTGASAVVNGSNLIAPHALHIVPFSVFLSAVSPANDYMSVIGQGSLLAKVGAYNNGNVNVSITKVLFTDKGSHTGTTTTLEMYYSQQNPGASSPLWFAGPVGCNPSVDFVSSAGTIPLDGSGFRFLTVNACSIGGAVAGDTWQFAIASHGHVRFAVAESDLGYDGNVDGQISGIINDLPTDGLPSLGKITMKP